MSWFAAIPIANGRKNVEKEMHTCIVATLRCAQNDETLHQCFFGSRGAMTSNQEKPPGLSWGMMLGLLTVAILVAALIAYRMIYPFFHPHAH